MAIDTILTENTPPYGSVKYRADDTDTAAQPQTLFYCLKTDEEIYFPVPTTITSNVGIQWEQRNFAGFGQGMQALKKFKESALEAQGDQGSQLAQLAKGFIGGIAKDAAMQVGNMVGSQQIQDLVYHAQGKILHPMSEMTFQGVGFRAFDFNFQMAPVSKKHQEQIAEAIKVIQKNSLPEVDTGNPLAYLTYPSSWFIEFLPSDKYLPSFLDAVITNVSVDYGAASRMSMHEENGPTKISLNISFVETTIYLAEHARGGYNG